MTLSTTMKVGLALLLAAAFALLAGGAVGGSLAQVLGAVGAVVCVIGLFARD